MDHVEEACREGSLAQSVNYIMMLTLDLMHLQTSVFRYSSKALANVNRSRCTEEKLFSSLYNAS